MTQQVTTSVTKISWRRDPAAPAGQPALGSFTCSCGAVIADVAFADGQEHPCSCGRTWDSRGWLVQR